MLDRKQCVELYENAACTGEVALFASTSREAYRVAKRRCTACPVVALCFSHVNPAEDRFTGTCAGRLYYEGSDVTDAPDALPPPVFRLADVDLLVATALLEGSTEVWEDHTESTLMTAFWGLRRKRVTLNRLAKLSGLDRDRVEQLVQAFDDGATPDFKDFTESQTW